MADHSTESLQATPAHRVNSHPWEHRCCKTRTPHHVMKHETRWQSRQEPDGTLVWTSPTGRTSRDPVADPVDLTGRDLVPPELPDPPEPPDPLPDPGDPPF
ncbi:hypothetical protein JCM11754A_30660 [Isoptericola variabilis]